MKRKNPISLGYSNHQSGQLSQPHSLKIILQDVWEQFKTSTTFFLGSNTGKLESSLNPQDHL